MQPILTFKKQTIRGAHLGAESELPDLTGEIVLQNQLAFHLNEYAEIFQGYGRIPNSYPYRQYNTYSRNLTDLSVKTATLENQYLKAVFLLEYGGRLWSLIDKTTGKNLLYTNDVLQFSNLAVRNAWFSGGVEWNIGIIGHSPFTTSPIYVAQLEGNGIPILRMYEYERIRQVYFQMDFWLDKEDKFLNCRMKIINENDHLVPMYWWSNIAVPEHPNGRIVVPADTAYTSKNMKVYKVDIPVVENIDVTHYEDITISIDYFFDIPQGASKYIANLDHQGYGLLQRSTQKLQGRKLFCWGNIPAANRWQEFLTQNAGRYIEIQAGLTKTQYGCMPMAPHTVWEWIEQYGAVQMEPRTLNSSHSNRHQTLSYQLHTSKQLENLEHILIATREMAKKPAQLVQKGSGYATLVKQKSLSKHLEFVSEEDGIKNWKQFLDTGVLHCPPCFERPDHFFCDEQSFQLLENTIETTNKLNWYAHYHLGVRLLQLKRFKESEKHLQYSLFLEENPWSLHALTCLKCQMQQFSEAIVSIQKGILLNLESLSYLKDGFKLLFSCKGFFELIECYQKLSPEMQNNSRLRFYYAYALHFIGKNKQAYEIIQNPKDFVLEDVREGEDSIAQLWADVTTALFGTASPLPWEYTFKSF